MFLEALLKKTIKMILVKNIAKLGFLKAIVDLLNYLKADIWRIFVVISLSDEWKKKAIEYGINNIKVLKEMNT
ncbi:MAG: hypothetical protein DRN04_04415 [Thermoprotei archaeon]|nr:MAG: hypothetical protein DRN04_04415 [Thermoprotei archaeon]